MSAFHDDLDSDMSDNEEGQDVTGWLDEEDEEVEQPKKAPPIQEDLKQEIDMMLKPAYIIKNSDLFYAMCELEDLEFESMPDEQQEIYMRSLYVETYQPGECIIREGDVGNDLYFVVATQDTNRVAEVEVIQNQDSGQEQFLTKLRRGQYFGQKFFLTRKMNKRGATVRVPKDSPIAVDVARLTPEHFDKWAQFRYVLLAKAVPLIQKLPRKERSQILLSLQVREYRGGDYIVHQGEIGEEFFIIQEGEVKVVETRPSPENPNVMIDVPLVTLREGNVFGEMSLVTNEPRVANVISVGNSICLSLSKSVFRSALSDESFREIVDEVLSKRKVIREQRKTKDEEIMAPSLGDSGKSASAMSGMRKMSMRSRSKSLGPGNDVNITSTLSMKKLDSGFRVINQYIIERELGKGSFGDVYLVRDQDTDEQYAMKIIQRPAQNSWNEDAANSIRQEIAVMKRMKHHNVVALREVIDDQSQRKIYLIQEFMEKGALMPDAETCDPIHVETARTYFRDILRGVCYLHSEGIIHRDIKPQNMLLSADGTVKIADFGAAVFTGAQQKVAFGGTPLFMAPELYRPATSGGAKVDFTKSPGIDVFALGATLYYMLMGRPPWVANTPIELAKQITDIELQFPVAVDPSVRHLLKQMLKKDPRTRCKLDDIVMDEWVTLEGSEPLFDKDETFIDNYTDFGAYIALDDVNAFNPSLRILLVHESLVVRTMLHNQLNLQHTALTACAASGDRAVQILQQVMKHPIYGAHNFDFVFVDILPLDVKTGTPQKHLGLQTVSALKATGYPGKIVGMNGTSGALSMDDMALETEFVAAGCFSVVKRPIANRELAMLLTRTTSTSTAEDHAKRVSAEEFEAAITVSRSNAMQRLTSESRKTSTTESQMDLSIISGSNTGYSSPAQTHHNHLNQHHLNMPHEGSTGLGMHSGSVSAHNSPNHLLMSLPSTDKTENDVDIAMDFTLNDLLDFDVCRRDSTPAPSAKPVPRKSLVRKGGFMALKGSNSDLVFDDDAHQPVKIFSLKDSNTKDEMKKRAERRAMMRSQALQQYREAKKVGDEPRTKSMYNILKQSSRKSMFERKKSTRTSSSESTKSLHNKSMMNNNNVNGGNPVGGLDTPPSQGSNSNGSAKHALWSQLSPHQMAMTRLEDVFIEEIHNEDDNFDSDEDHQQQKAKTKTMSARKKKEVAAHGSDSDLDMQLVADSDADEEVDEEEDDEDDDGSIEESSDEEDDDLGNLDAEIMELDDQAMSDLFDTLVLKKDGKEQDMREWDHTIFGVNLAHTLTVSKADLCSSDLGLKFGVAESQGCRNYMEDRIYAKAVEASRVAEGLPPLGIFAVFDGHGGDAVAQYLQTRYASVFASAYRHLETHLDFTQIDPESGIYEAAVARAFEETAARIDRSLLEKDYARQQKQQAGSLANATTSSSSGEGSFAGSVGVIAVVAPAKQTVEGRACVQIFVSHVGDCRAVLSQDGVAKALTEDHKATNKAEKARVECAGGFVQNGRVNGALMVSRSFGDIQHKNFALCVGHKGHEGETGGIWAECQSVISRPEFTHFLVYNDSFEFIILASDGLWDVFENQEAVNFVRKRLLTNKDVEKTAEELVQKALQRGSQDNTSAIIVAFNQ